MQYKFQVGDRVSVIGRKGPAMTVSGQVVATNLFEKYFLMPRYLCSYDSGQELATAVFTESELELAVAAGFSDDWATTSYLFV